jgi:hypothetical protein
MTATFRILSTSMFAIKPPQIKVRIMKDEG